MTPEEAAAAWELAQEAERAWWMKCLTGWQKQLVDADRKTRETAFRRYAKTRFLPVWQMHVRKPEDRMDFARTDIVEVGSGPVPLITVLVNARRRVAVDPLFSFYADYTHFRPGRKNLGVHFVQDRAEEYTPRRPVDFILLSNVLDHCEDPALVLKNCVGGLKPGGAVLLDVILRPADKLPRMEHPHGWTCAKDIEQLINETDLPPISVPYWRQLKAGTGRLFLRIVRSVTPCP